MTAAQVAKARRLRAAGYTLEEIMERVGARSLYPAWKACKGVKRGPLRHTVRFWLKDKVDRDREIRELRAQGVTYRELGEMFGVSRQRAEQIAKGDRPR
jgi:hypothetical protein